MITILGISGSLRKGSFNTALLNAAIELAPEGCRIEAGHVSGIPLYDGDTEASEGIPAAVMRLKDRIAAADGLLLVTPEYNNSIPGVFKNAIDWLSRPPEDIGRVFGNRPVGVIGASTGSFGTILSQLAWLAVLRALSTRPWFGRTLYVSNASNVFDESGKLINHVTRDRLQAYLVGFVEFVRQAR
jgi:NAD(P)H-dependent FMN reductase